MDMLEADMDKDSFVKVPRFSGRDLMQEIIDFVLSKGRAKLLPCPFCGSEARVDRTSYPSVGVDEIGRFFVDLEAKVVCCNRKSTSEARIAILSECAGESSLVSGRLYSMDDALLFVKFLEDSWNKRSGLECREE